MIELKLNQIKVEVVKPLLEGLMFQIVQERVQNQNNQIYRLQKKSQ